VNFNVSQTVGKFLCPSCGLPGYFDGTSYDSNMPLVGTGICPCCFFEPGFDDDASADAKPTVLASILHYRAKWIALRMPWRGNDDYWLTKPVDWDPVGQLDALYVAEPGLKG
jgi:hypothetical protein